MKCIKNEYQVQWLLVALFFCAILFKVVFFHWECFHSLMISSLWRSPMDFFEFWLPKISITLFLSCFVFVSKHPWWTIVILLFIDVWCLANIIYFRSYGLFIDWPTMQLAGNMDGFWGSVLFYVSWKELFLLLSSVIYILLFCYVKNAKSITINLKIFACSLALSYILSIAGIYCYTYKLKRCLIHNMYTKEAAMLPTCLTYNPFNIKLRYACGNTSDQVYLYSIIHSFIWSMIDATSIEHEGLQLDIDDLDQQTVETIPYLLNETYTDSMGFSSKLIVLIVESLEDWAINPVTAPHLYHFVHTHNCFYVPHIQCQVKKGMSADGQMIINTGLLPIQSEATCYAFPLNTYPSIASCCKGRTVNIIPHKIDVWNQQYMSPAYAYDTTIIRSQVDSILAFATIEAIHNGYQMVQTITMSSHAPFEYGIKYSHLTTPTGMPNHMANYMKSISYADDGIAILLDAMDNDSLMQDVTLVITGDHVIFPDEQRHDYAQYVEQNNLSFCIKDAFVPLIIYSSFDQFIMKDVEAYQMDIYPTIMSLLGCKDYYWKGFGVDLMNDSMVQNRTLISEQAFHISDQLIRSNYFKSINLYEKHDSCH